MIVDLLVTSALGIAVGLSAVTRTLPNAHVGFMASTLVRPRSAPPAMEVTALDEASFRPTLDACDRLAVVKFYAPWCRTCKQVGPIFAKTAEKYRDRAHFFEVDFSSHRMVSRENQVLLLPTIQFFVPGLIGCVERFTLTYPKRKLLNTQLDAFLADGKLDQLRALDPEALSPLVRFKELHGAVQALKKAPEYLKEKEATWVTERQQSEMKALFRWLDRNGDGKIDEEEMKAACAALQASGIAAEEEVAMTLEELSEMMIAADGDESTNTVDEAAFLRVMAQRASDEIKDTDALLATFKALDLDGNGVLEVNEIVEALANVKGALAETDSVGAAIFGDIDAMSINNLLAAFDLDELGPLESASVDYEEFVNMVAGRRL